MKTYLVCALLTFMHGEVIAEGNPQSCLTSVEAGKDYFPDKVVPTRSKLWTVSYHNTYKIVKNLDDDTTYLLYQCGSEPPQNVQANLTLSVPLQNGVALAVTPHIPHFELLGLRDEIKAYLGDPQYISSPCMNARLKSGETLNIRRPFDEGQMDRLFEETSPDIVVMSNDGYAPKVDNYVTAAAWKERNNHGIGEWHKYFSVFFNAEAKANEDFQGMFDRYECTKANAQDVLTDRPSRPKVVVAEFSTYCGGFSVGSCPNFYCDFANDCSAEMLEHDNEGSIVNPKCGNDRKYKTAAEFVEFAKDADMWLYPGHGSYNFTSAYKDFGEELDKLKVVKEKKVFDTVLTDYNTWYEHRLVEYGECVCMSFSLVF